MSFNSLSAVEVLEANIQFYDLALATNALLRCEQRNAKATADHLKHLTQRIVKMPSVANHS
ncbi:hypothetical protein [Vibrio parahaemolyticus]|uniref:hypothetical protein n=1 Tax=Vibrio parahaemolyticus TaxID=670 RepID=UPI002490B819|nr:hypothetical protein [Vibrio parahaemolyticus]